MAVVQGVAAAANIGLSVFGMGQAAKSAKAAQDAANAQQGVQDKYNLQAYKFNKLKILKQYGDTIKKIDLAAKNEQILANFKDANSFDSYAQALKIKDLQQTAQNNAYEKSEQLYKTQLSLNAQAAAHAKETQFAALNEEVAKFAVANSNLVIENILNSAKAQAKGTAGNAAVKANQAFLAAKGAKQALSAKGISSLQQNALMQLQKLEMDKNAADVTAFAQKLLPPQEIPDPLVPYKTPLSEYIYPDPPTKMDFGPKPQPGAMMQSAGNWANALANYLPSVAKGAQQLAQAFIQPQQPQTSNFGKLFANQAAFGNVSYAGTTPFTGFTGTGVGGNYFSSISPSVTGTFSAGGANLPTLDFSNPLASN